MAQDMTAPCPDRKVPVAVDSTHALRLSRTMEGFALGSIVIFHLALVIFLAATLNVWIDEAYTLRSTTGGILHAVRRALGFELQPPLYFFLLALWRNINDSVFFARLFSILCTSSTVFLAGGLVRRYLPGVSSVLVSAAVAFNPLTVYTAVDARCYALVLLLSVLLLLFYYDGYLAAEPSAAARRWHTVVSVAALYTYYYLGFILAAGAAALLMLRRYRALRSYIVGMAATAVLFAPLAVVTVHQFGSLQNTGLSPHQSLVEASSMMWNTVWRQLLPVSQESLLSVVRSWVSRLALPLLALAVLLQRRRMSSAVLVPLTIASSVSLFYLGIAIRLGPDFMKPQHAIVLYLPMLLAALGLLRYAGGVRAVNLGAAVSLVFFGPYLGKTYAPLAKQGDWIRVSRYIEQREKTPEPILVFKAEFVLDFGYHYTGRNLLIPIPGPTSKEHYDLKEMVLRDEGQILHQLYGQLGASRRFWLVTIHTVPFRGIDVHPEILEGFVARRCTILDDKSFVGSHVRLLELRPEAGEAKRAQPQ